MTIFKGYHWQCQEDIMFHESAILPTLSIDELTTQSFCVDNDKNNWANPHLPNVHQRLYEVIYELGNPMIMKNCPLEVFGLSEKEVERYKDFYGYDGLIYNPCKQTEPYATSFIQIFNAKQSIKKITLIKDGYFDESKNWIETLNINPIDIYEAGKQCIINSNRDLGINKATRTFIWQPCTIIKRTKAGLIQVFLNSDPKLTISVPQYNVDLI